MLASTWNKELAHNYAQAIGEECQAGNIPVLLGPGMNIYRISQCGRNFEYFGEDPFLAARMVENYVIGLQSTGTIATLKHFVANNSDYFRRKSNSVVDLLPDEKIRVDLILDKSAFSFWSPVLKAWTMEEGKFEIMVGSSSDTILLNAEIEFKD